jgi:hypothetical protein
MLARRVLKQRHGRPVSGNQDLKHELPTPVPIMNTHPSSELPPADFVAFLAQRSGLSQEAAEHRLERWFGEYTMLPRVNDRLLPASLRGRR